MPTLSKEERLYGEGPVRALFSRGRRFSVGLKPEKNGQEVHVPESVRNASSSKEEFPQAFPKRKKKGKPSRASFFPLQVFYLLEEPSAMCLSGSVPVPCRVMVHAPKRVFKHAVDRNRIKRLLREAYRARKSVFEGLVPPGKVMLISLQFSGDRNVSFPEMNAYVEQALKMLSSRFHHA